RLEHRLDALLGVAEHREVPAVQRQQVAAERVLAIALRVDWNDLPAGSLDHRAHHASSRPDRVHGPVFGGKMPTSSPRTAENAASFPTSFRGRYSRKSGVTIRSHS